MQQSTPQDRHRRPQFQQYGKLARKRREQRGWTQEEVASKLGTISRAQLSRIESGYSLPSPFVLSKLGDLLDIPVADSYALTGYWPCSELPSLRAYFLAKHGDWPVEVIDDIEKFYDYKKTEHGLSE
jgi:transcriptional regulator with XRE-family HTH domain